MNYHEINEMMNLDLLINIIEMIKIIYIDNNPKK
jgi:hypothetical protein